MNGEGLTACTESMSPKGSTMRPGKIDRFLEGVEQSERELFEALLGRREPSKAEKRAIVAAMDKDGRKTKRLERIREALSRACPVCGEERLMRRVEQWTREFTFRHRGRTPGGNQRKRKQKTNKRPRTL